MARAEGASDLLIGLFFLAYAISLAAAHSHSIAKEKVSHLHFFLHDTISGKTPSAVQVAQPNVTIGVLLPSPAPFGTVFAINDAMTSGPELKPDAVVGSAQGLYVSTGLEEISLVMAVDFGFTTGKYNGSSFSVMSRNPVAEGDRELAVVGGRGKFRLGRGFAELRTHLVNVTTGDAVIEYNVTVFHY